MLISNVIATTSLTFIAALAVAAPANAAVIAYQDFDASPANVWSFTNDGGNLSSATGANDVPANSRSISGISYRASADTDGAVKTSTLTFSSFSVADYEGVRIAIPLAAISKTTGNGLDGPDFVKAYVAVDGGAFSATPDILLNGNANARWAFSASESAHTVAGTPLTVKGPIGLGGGNGPSANGISMLLIDVPDAASSVALKLVFSVDNTGEIWAVDNVALNGTAVVPEPASLGLVTAGGALLLGRRSRRRTV